MFHNKQLQKPAGVSEEQWQEYLILKDMASLGVTPSPRPSVRPESNHVTHHQNRTEYQDRNPPLVSDHQVEQQTSKMNPFNDTQQNRDPWAVSNHPDRSQTEKSNRYEDRDMGAASYGQWTEVKRSENESDSGAWKSAFSPPAYKTIRSDLTPHGVSSVNSVASTSARDESAAVPSPTEFTSPFAHTMDWSPTAQDAVIVTIPEQSFKIRVQQRFARSPGSVFDKPPPSFSRPVPPKLTNQPATFSPYESPGKGAIMGDGFKPFYPGRRLAARDISLADWQRFLEDLEVAGRLTGVQSIVSNVAPLTMHIGLTGYFVTKAIEKGMKKKKELVVLEALQVWQDTFFTPRGVLVEIQEKGKGIRGQQGARRNGGSSSESDDSDKRKDPNDRKDRKERKDARRKEKKEKREKRKRKVTYTMVVRPL